MHACMYVCTYRCNVYMHACIGCLFFVCMHARNECNVMYVMNVMYVTYIMFVMYVFYVCILCMYVCNVCNVQM